MTQGRKYMAKQENKCIVMKEIKDGIVIKVTFINDIKIKSMLICFFFYLCNLCYDHY